MLDPRYRAVLDLLKQRGAEEFREGREDRLTPTYERVGLRSPQVAEIEAGEKERLRRSLMGTEADLLMRGVGREEQLEDVAGAEQHAKSMNLQDWFNRFRHQEQEQAGMLERQTLGHEQSLERMETQRGWEEEDMERQDEQRKKDLIKNIIGMGANILTGGIAGAATKGVTALQGALMGGSGMAQMGMQKSMYNHILGQGQNQDLLNTIGDRGPLSNYYQNPYSGIGDLNYGGTGRLNLSSNFGTSYGRGY